MRVILQNENEAEIVRIYFRHRTISKARVDIAFSYTIALLLQSLCIANRQRSRLQSKKALRMCYTGALELREGQRGNQMQLPTPVSNFDLPIYCQPSSAGGFCRHLYEERVEVGLHSDRHPSRLLLGRG